ncbi:MAG TPA: cytochrome C oxidase subunit IV family protein [Thermomicrobiales bacterium]|nr:cytochrome C oxidase subunit IV family protein [Thermomicrobiales bacterium]
MITQRVVPVGVYVAVWVALMCLLGGTIVASLFDLGLFNPVIALLIAAAKGLLIIFFFMHVKYAGRLVFVFAAAGFFWLGILMVLSMSDYVSRTWLNVPGK